MPQTSFRDHLLQCLGGPWPEGPDLNVRVLEEHKQDGITRLKVLYDAEPEDAVPAYLLIPDKATSDQPAPAIAIWHQHAGQWHLGKSEPAGLAGDAMHHTGLALAREGYVVLCPDARCFEERQHPVLENCDYERFEFLRYVVEGKCLAWKHILDMRRAIDFLCSRPEVDSDRLGCYGHSMGSTHTWLVGPWEPRLKCLAGNCCLPTYRGIHRDHLLHCFANFIPGLYTRGDTPDVAALIAPRPLLLNFGAEDAGCPRQDLDESIATIAAAYEKANASDHFSPFVEEGAEHELSAAMWQRVRDWFEKHLRG